MSGVNDSDKRRLFQKLWGDHSREGQFIFNFLLGCGSSVPSNKTILDLGAGECRYRFFFDHANYIGVDFGRGDSQWDYRHLDIIGDITSPSFIRDHSVDFCLNTVTLEHLCEPQKFFKEVERILKPGGKMFLYVPMVAQEHQVPYDFYRYTSYGLKHLATTAGLETIYLEGTTGALENMARWSDIALRGADARPFWKKLLLKSIKLSYHHLILPVLVFADYHLVTDNMVCPGLWCMIVEKKCISPSVSDEHENTLANIVCCPSCKNQLIFADTVYCGTCDKIYADNRELPLNFCK